ncbi:FAD/NAD(P)-binding protein [Actinoplanes teichomyceticus]|uniref:FAD-NAD(P)-binding protein n=1 Tax=Actinoplanes teichomyceticus TaxID=1867 RepID=A0A561WBM7_ACTTI|nr:FAD/NAD(P)-binding protein [Actinoplanes teichomyceticus]TWG21270.1 FAD-NAD(P)-binding protein [Actinoplanes teichomyceticus]GIF16717.1 hypothetical protein Ate01nite_67490 [Actinoplanes teichomyceticus]
MSADDTLAVAIVGMGPRGLAVLERIARNAAGDPTRRVRVDVVDPYPPGAGRVWRTDQSSVLLMNTPAARTTVFADRAVAIEGDLREGPTLYEWARFQVLLGDLSGFPADVADELRALEPDSSATRRLFGHYLDWAYRHVLATSGDNVTIHAHATLAVALWDEPDGRQCLLLQTGDRIAGLDAVVLAQGHYPVTPTGEEQRLAGFAVEQGLTYVLPANPADVDLSMVRPGEPTLLRGVGMCLSDYLALLTEGRAGRYVRDDRGRLDYLPSGLEPRLLVGSRWGLPGPAGGRDPRAGRRRRAGAPLDLGADAWPRIAKEVETAFYTALLRRDVCDCTARAFQADYLAVAWRSPAERDILERYPISRRWSWDDIGYPGDGPVFAGPDELREWLLDRLDPRPDPTGDDGPIEAAVGVLDDLRDEVRLALGPGGLTDAGRRRLDQWYTPINALLGLGLPAARTEQLAALIRAGVVQPAGADLHVEPHPDRAAFLVTSAQTPGVRHQVTGMIEARLPRTDLRRTADPLLSWMLANRTCAVEETTDPTGAPYVTGAVAVTGRPFRPVTAAGQAHPRRFVFGVPPEGVCWSSAGGARPGVSPATLADADAISLAVLGIAGGVEGRAGDGTPATAPAAYAEDGAA